VATTDPDSGAPLPTVDPAYLQSDTVTVTAHLHAGATRADFEREAATRRAVLAWNETFALRDIDRVSPRKLGRLSGLAPERLLRGLERNQTASVTFVLRAADKPAVHATLPLVEFRRAFSWRPKRAKRRLVSVPGPLRAWFPPTPPEPDRVAAAWASSSSSSSPLHESRSVVGYWYPGATLGVVRDEFGWPIASLDSAPGSPRAQIDAASTVVDRATRQLKSAKYLPRLLAVHTDASVDASMRRVRVNTTGADELELTVTVQSMTLARHLLTAQLEAGLDVHRELGTLTDEDLDEVRSLLTETSPAVLALTVVVSVVHIMFDVLALKSEISFWSSLRSARGVSLGSMFAALGSQAVVSMYLVDQDASKLVVVPAVAGVGVQMWKIVRALALSRAGSDGAAATAATAAVAAAERTEDERRADSDAVRYMTAVLAPVVAAYSAVTLLRDDHEGWPSWALSSLTACVYAGGFVLMWPQVFLNHRLKSVAAMDFTTLLYRFFNTFIDDFFALLLPMPGMHRLATLRDDVVFLVFLYQRWVYPRRESAPAASEADVDQPPPSHPDPGSGGEDATEPVVAPLPVVGAGHAGELRERVARGRGKVTF